MGPSESINRALNAFFNGFGIPAIWKITSLPVQNCRI